MARGKSSRSSTGIPLTIDHSRACDHCGYDLVGLRADGVCPECGTPITRGRKFGQEQDALGEAPMYYLRTLARGTPLLLVGWTGMVVCLGMVGVVGMWIVAAMMTLLALVWWLGVVLVTVPRPDVWEGVRDSAPGAVGGLEAWGGAWLIYRVAARVLEAFWVVGAAAACAILATTTPSGTPNGALRAVGSISVMLASAGMIPLNLYLSDLAHRAGDSGLLASFRTLSWFLLVSVPLFVFTGVVAVPFMLPFYTRSLGGYLAVVSPIVGFLVLAPIIWQLVCLVQFHQIASWAVRNRWNDADRTLRLQARADAEAKGLGEPRECEACGYDMTGLPVNAVCPECGAIAESLRLAHVPPSLPRKPLDLPPIPLSRPRPPDGSARSAPRQGKRPT